MAVYHLLLRRQRQEEEEAGGGDGDGATAGDKAAAAAAARAATAARRRAVALAVACLVAAVLGLVKELGDGPLALWPGRASLRDGAADVLGIAAAVAWARARGARVVSAPSLAERGGDDEGVPLVVRTLRPPAATPQMV